MDWGCSSVIERLPSMCKAMGLTPPPEGSGEGVVARVFSLTTSCSTSLEQLLEDSVIALKQQSPCIPRMAEPSPQTTP
jgi:hypothetical protein